MEFAGRLYYDFTCPFVFRFYRFLAAAAGAGARIGLDWRPFSLEQAGRDAGPPIWEVPEESTGALDALAASEWVRAAAPHAHGGFVHEVLTAVHDAGTDPGDWSMLATAATRAGCDPAELETAVRRRGETYPAVGASHRGAVELGVFGTPTLYRHGPVLFVKLLPPALGGDPLARLAVIDAVLGDDGIWELKKP